MYILYECQIWLAASKRAQMDTFYEFYKQNEKKEDFLKSTQGIHINIVYITLACYVILCSLYNILQYPISLESIRIFVLVPKLKIITYLNSHHFHYLSDIAALSKNILAFINLILKKKYFNWNPFNQNWTVSNYINIQSLI